MFNKKIIAVAVFSFSMLTVASSHAASNAPYVGAQIGYGNVHQNNNLIDSDSKDTGVAGRLFAGYQFNDYFAAEMGWSKFSNATAKFSNSVLNVNETIKTDAIDLVAKGIYPVTSEVKVYGKLGAAYLMTRANVKGSYYGYAFNESETQRKVLPTAGVGVSYDINSNLAADISYNRIQKVGNSDLVNSTDLVSAGLIYSIG